MINELFLSKNYTSFWKGLFPNGEDYIRLINVRHGVKRRNFKNQDDEPQRRILINGLAFSLFELTRHGNHTEQFIDSFQFESPFGVKMIEDEIKRVTTANFGSDLNNKLNTVEMILARTIASQILRQFDRKTDLLLRPLFVGCGILDDCEGDLFYSDTLCEVKAGQRNFSILDIRQLFIYLMLNEVSIHSKRNIKYIELFNPRLNILWREDAEKVAKELSGNSLPEVLHEMINFVSLNEHSI